MRPEIICSVLYCTGIKCLSCEVMMMMMMCWKYELLFILLLHSRDGGAGQGEERGGGCQAGSHRLHTKVSKTQTCLTWPGRSQWLISPRAALHFCDKVSKNVNKFSVSANLPYYLRTAAEKICLVDKCLFLDRKEHKAEALCGGGRFWFDVRLRNISFSFFLNSQPWDNF